MSGLILNELIAAHPIAAATARFIYAQERYNNCGPDGPDDAVVDKVQAAHDALLELLQSTPEPSRFGAVDVVVRLLDARTARDEYPELFDRDDGDDYFNELPANGNNHWADYVPDLVLIVATWDGKPVMSSNASRWHMEACGFEQALEALQ